MIVPPDAFAKKHFHVYAPAFSRK